MALAAAKDLPRLGLVDALELTILVARKDPRRHPRVAARWLLRFLEECPAATIEEAALAASSLGRGRVGRLWPTGTVTELRPPRVVRAGGLEPAHSAPISARRILGCAQWA